MSNIVRLFMGLIADRQYNRILRLSFPHDDGPKAQLLPNKLDATEYLSRDFEYRVELLSDDPNIALKEMQGKLLNIELVRGNRTVRHFTGYVFSFRRIRSDGGITFYEAKLGPWLQFLGLRKNNYIFHNKTLREQTEKVFGEYSVYPRWEWHVGRDDTPMTDACQFDETDFNYLSRRWEAAGLHYWYEHTADGHKLIISDDSTRAAAIDGDVEVRFHAEGGQTEEDAIDHWSAIRHVAPSSVALGGFDFKQPSPSEHVMPTLNNQGAVPYIESYEYVGAYGYKNRSDGEGGRGCAWKK